MTRGVVMHVGMLELIPPEELAELRGVVLACTPDECIAIAPLLYEAVEVVPVDEVKKLRAVIRAGRRCIENTRANVWERAADDAFMEAIEAAGLGKEAP